MNVNLRLPGRPKPRDPRAKLVMAWAEVAFYVFCLVLLAATLATQGPTLLGSIR